MEICGMRIATGIGCVGLFLLPIGTGYADALKTESDAMAKAVAANKAKDYGTSIAIYNRLMDHGNAAAPAMLGLMYWIGAGVQQGRAHACDLFAVSEQRGDPNGTELLADCFFKGDGRAQDYAQSALLYRKASDRGVAIADCALGNQYLRGLGVEKDQAKAAVLCRQSADRGVADAQTDLGQMYLQGVGVERDPQQAARWFQKAAAQNQANAALLLGTMFWNGDGVERSHEQAAKAWHLSAEHGNTSAPARLAKYYFAAGVIPAEKRVLPEPASRAVYWGTVATRVDPDPAARLESQKLIDMLLSVAPNLKVKAEAMLATADPPSL
jgi:TPR repeat protein